MKRKTHRRPYWRETKRLAVLTLALTALTVFLSLIGPGFGGTLLGLPLGFFLALHGSVVICLIAVARFAVRQDEIDQWHGAQEDI